MSVHEKIRLVRQAKGLTQEEIAEKLEMSVSAYGDMERGDSDPKLSKLQKLAELFEMSLSQLLDLSETGTLNINFACKKYENNVYVGSVSSELEKEKLANQFKDKEIELYKEKIADLNKIIALLEKTMGNGIENRHV